MSKPKTPFPSRVDLLNRVIALGVWVPAFMALSWFLVNYENLMNYGSLSASGHVWISTFTVGLWNEGPIGYAVLAGIGFCGLMFCREFVGFMDAAKRISRSLASTSENLMLMPEVKK